MREEEENVSIYLVYSSTREYQAMIKGEVEMLREAMEMVYQEMSKQDHIVDPILEIQSQSNKES